MSAEYIYSFSCIFGYYKSDFNKLVYSHISVICPFHFLNNQDVCDHQFTDNDISTKKYVNLSI